MFGRFIKLLCLSLSFLPFISCGKTGNGPSPKQSDLDTIRSLYATVPIVQDGNGFVDFEKCDSLLFSSLILSGNKAGNIFAAELSPGEWLRRPTEYPECYSVGKSRSTISRDMLLGVYVYAWRKGDRSILERIWDYGEDNFWRMGDGRHGGADTIMNSAMISTLGQLIYMMGGENHFISRNLPVTFGVKESKEVYYVNRLTAIHLMLRREAYGELSDVNEGVLDRLAELFPDNPLFQLASGNRSEAARLAAKGYDVPAPSGVHNNHEYLFEWTFVAGELVR